MKKPRIIVWDIETSPIIVNTWTLYPQSLSHENIIKDWFIICAAWRVVGESKVHAVSIDRLHDDYKVVKTLRDELSKADLWVTHNGDKFDVKKLNARLIIHKLPPFPNIPTIDTKKEAKRVAAFTSNRLDHLTKTLTGSGKVHVDYDLWLRVMNGSKSALKEMVKYNKVDVIKDEELYLRLRPYMKYHPHLGVISGYDKQHSCPNCGSTKFKKNGTKPTRAGIIKQECQCSSCHSYFKITIEK